MLTPMAPNIPSRNGQFDSTTGHLAPFTRLPFRQFAPIYSRGISTHPNNLRLAPMVRSNLLEELRSRKSRKLELSVS